MGNKLFFGGLAWGTTEASLKAACEEFGEIEEVRIIVDRATGRSKGFGFVTFTTDEAAQNAKNALDGTMLDGRTIKVDFPREREERGPRGGGYGARGGYGDRYGDRDRGYGDRDRGYGDRDRGGWGRDRRY